MGVAMVLVGDVDALVMLEAKERQHFQPDGDERDHDEEEESDEEVGEEGEGEEDEDEDEA
jgi:hypothetical protein